MWNYFLSMLMLIFTIACTIAGIFTVYFASGKSRAIGGIIIILGLLVFIIFLYGANLLSGFLGSPVGILNIQGTIIQGVVSILGGILGGGVAIGIFLISIMKT